MWEHHHASGVTDAVQIARPRGTDKRSRWRACISLCDKPQRSVFLFCDVADVFFLYARSTVGIVGLAQWHHRLPACIRREV